MCVDSFGEDGSIQYYFYSLRKGLKAAGADFCAPPKDLSWEPSCSMMHEVRKAARLHVSDYH